MLLGSIFIAVTISQQKLASFKNNEIICTGFYVYYLLTGCEVCTAKYKPAVCRTARTCKGCKWKVRALYFTVQIELTRLINSLLHDKIEYLLP